MEDIELLNKQIVETIAESCMYRYRMSADKFSVDTDVRFEHGRFTARIEVASGGFRLGRLRIEHKKESVNFFLPSNLCVIPSPGSSRRVLQFREVEPIVRNEMLGLIIKLKELEQCQKEQNQSDQEACGDRTT